jgi:hypothetical protein
MRSIARHLAGGYLCLLAVLTAGCASTSSSSKGEWQPTQVRETPYQKVLVVAVMPDREVRRAMDQILAAEISDRGANGISGFAVAREMGVSELSRDLVIAMAEKTGADAIIVTKVVNRDAQIGDRRGEVVTKFNPGVVVTTSEDGSMSSVMASRYWVEVTPGSSTIDGDAILESYLYEPATGDKLIYRATSQGDFRIGAGERIEGVAEEFAILIAKQLHRDGVIP